MLKLEYHRQLTVIRIAVQFRKLCRRAPRLADRDQIRFLKGLPAELPQILVKPWSIVRDLLIRLFGNLVNHIETKSPYALLNPPVDHVINFPAQFRIFPVQIRLLDRKLVKIVLLYFGNPLPCRPAKRSPHAVWQFSLLAIAPDIVVMIRILSAFLRFLKPEMLVRGMI